MSAPIEVPRHDITGIVLAGGLGRRLGGADKGLLALQGRAMVEHVLERLRPQVGRLLISANRNRERYAALGFPVVPDTIPDYPGPLAGLAAGMQAAATLYVVTAPCDAPRLHPDLVRRLFSALILQRAEISVAHDGNRLQPTFALLRRTLLPDLLAFLASGGRGVERWCRRHCLAIADFADGPEAFLNVNDPHEYARLEPGAALPPVQAKRAVEETK